MVQVPTVNLRDTSSTSLAELDRACREHGFLPITGHRLDDLIERTWEQTRRFFTADPHVRRRITRSEDLDGFEKGMTEFFAAMAGLARRGGAPGYRDLGTDDIPISRFRV